MVLEIFIDRLDAGIYEVHSTINRSEVCEPSIYSSIEDAIRSEAANFPEGLAYLIEFTYAGISTGTLTPEDAQARAGALADRLVGMLGELSRRIEADRPAIVFQQ